MLQHHNSSPKAPQRTVILGAAGFVGGACAARLARDGGDVLALGRGELDLLADDAAARLKAILRPDDALVIVSAKAPVKNAGMLVDNLRMIAPVCEVLDVVELSHVVYISSDAVYADSDGPLTERSVRAPDTLHGVMHLAREVALSASARAPLALLRPSLLYGAKDPHNGYGPNRFRRLAAEGKDIVLFGQGEERRDHVYIDDVAELVSLVLRYRSAGTLNIATGSVTSFGDIARMVVQQMGANVTITGSPRQGAMPHNGYRPFDPAATLAAFPSFAYTPLVEGLARVR